MEFVLFSQNPNCSFIKVFKKSSVTGSPDERAEHVWMAWSGWWFCPQGDAARAAAQCSHLSHFNHAFHDVHTMATIRLTGTAKLGGSHIQYATLANTSSAVVFAKLSAFPSPAHCPRPPPLPAFLSPGEQPSVWK